MMLPHEVHPFNTIFINHISKINVHSFIFIQVNCGYLCNVSTYPGKEYDTMSLADSEAELCHCLGIFPPKILLLTWRDVNGPAGKARMGELPLTNTRYKTVLTTAETEE
ncbi:hypothetical protein RND81_04G077000 [Saponaria officinalis]|uniref:Uncharacterized protein n=1 Tax=Saponaria officinalis TaxID=3572 RepID=A0AAW1LJQ8_SAPOF